MNAPAKTTARAAAPDMDPVTGIAGARPRLVAVVVTYNRLDQIQTTVARLLDGPCDLVCVVDNGSQDGTEAWLEAQQDPRLRVLRTDENRGGAGGFEMGLRFVAENFDPDWMVLMDDDARPDPGCLEAFLAADTSEYDAVSAAVYLRSGEICEMNRPTINPFWNAQTFCKTALALLFGRSRAGFHVPDTAYEAGPLEIDATSFVGLFLPRETIARAGYPDGGMFIYGDDVHYTLSLRKAGMRIGFLPDLRFEHDYNRTHGGKRGVFSPIWKAYYTARNGIIVYRYAAGPMMFWVAFAIIFPRWLMDGRRYGETRRTYYRLLWAGVKDGFRGRRIRPHAEVEALAGP